MFGKPFALDQVLLKKDCNQRAKAPGIRAGLDCQMIVGKLCCFALAWIDNDYGAVGIFGNLAQDRSSACKAVGLPWVLADEDCYLAVLEVAMISRTKHAAIHPELACLLLCERIGAKLRAERLQCAVGICAAQMISLPTASIIEDRLSAILSLYLQKSHGYLRDRSLPIYRFECAVVAASQRRCQPVLAILIVVQFERLFAGV